MDWTPVIEAALALAAAIISVAALALRQWLNERILASQVGRVEGAAMRAAGQVLEELARSPTAQAKLDLLIADGAAYVARSLPDTVRRLGVNEARLAEMVRGELGKLRARP